MTDAGDLVRIEGHDERRYDEQSFSGDSVMTQRLVNRDLVAE
jgi:hypothetical protein